MFIPQWNVTDDMRGLTMSHALRIAIRSLSQESYENTSQTMLDEQVVIIRQHYADGARELFEFLSHIPNDKLQAHYERSK